MQEATTETLLVIRHFDEFFNCTNKLEGIFKRKDDRLPYYEEVQDRKWTLKLYSDFYIVAWLKDTFLSYIYLDKWGAEVMYINEDKETRAVQNQEKAWK